MDLATAQIKLLIWQNAHDAVAKGQSYAVDGLQLTRVDATQIKDNIDYWQRVVNEHIDVDSGHQPGVAVATWN